MNVDLGLSQRAERLRVLDIDGAFSPGVLRTVQVEAVVRAPPIAPSTSDIGAACATADQAAGHAWGLGTAALTYGGGRADRLHADASHHLALLPRGGLLARSASKRGWSQVVLPDAMSIVYDSDKMIRLDALLRRLVVEGHRVLIYSQMTRMLDLLEEYMSLRRFSYMRLDGSSRISDRRDMVADFQNRCVLSLAACRHDQLRGLFHVWDPLTCI